MLENQNYTISRKLGYAETGCCTCDIYQRRIHSRRRPAGPMGSDSGARSPPNAGCNP